MQQQPSLQALQGQMNDVHRGLRQQMYFWGMDVISHGNLLRAYGFERRPSPGHQGTSCYSMAWDGGLLELHGHCAGWYPQETGAQGLGYLFVRPHTASYAHERCDAVIPGDYRSHQTPKDLERIIPACQHFLRWVVEYERWVLETRGLAYRLHCHREFKRLPKSKPWLLPQEALRWWTAFSTNDPTLVRARRFKPE
jgi:hypothetical protein